MQLKHTMNKVISNTRTLKMEVKCKSQSQHLKSDAVVESVIQLVFFKFCVFRIHLSRFWRRLGKPWTTKDCYPLSTLSILPTSDKSPEHRHLQRRSPNWKLRRRCSAITRLSMVENNEPLSSGFPTALHIAFGGDTVWSCGHGHTAGVHQQRWFDM